MKAFAGLFSAIDHTTRTNAKVDAMAAYFAAAPEKDLLWCIALLTGNTPKRPVKSGDLKIWCAEVCNLPYWLFEESYHVVGDLAETITSCLPEPEVVTELSLTETMAFLKQLANAPDEEKKAAIIQMWASLPATQRFVFNKLITGNFRMGVSSQLVIKALAKHFMLAEDFVAHRLSGYWDPEEISLHDLLINTEHAGDYYRPYPFFLAYQLDVEPEALGDVAEWQAERKYDGIRGQIIVRNNELFVWSRGEELMTEKFPEFALLKNLLPDGTVIDGEVLAYKDGKPLPFSVMQTRIGRKVLSKKILADAPLVMICYDLLELGGTDFRDKPLLERRYELEKLLTSLPVAVPLVIAPVIDAKNWEEMRTAREEARLYNCEGLMLKRKTSVYETGRKRGNWWKWKVDPLTIDGVLIYAQRGHGRRANLYTDYTFAVWDGPELVPFAKAYSGLTDKELLEVDAWVKKHTIDKFGPVRSVETQLVFELAFEGISKSSRHKSGVAVRFPRILRWRKDKKPEDANTKQDLLTLIDTQHS
ncbi:ATP-dependent DNA ligase [Chitinophagaceae bacterium MMS25-I14]